MLECIFLSSIVINFGVSGQSGVKTIGVLVYTDCNLGSIFSKLLPKTNEQSTFNNLKNYKLK